MWFFTRSVKSHDSMQGGLDVRSTNSPLIGLTINLDQDWYELRRNHVAVLLNVGDELHALEKLFLQSHEVRDDEIAKILTHRVRAEGAQGRKRFARRFYTAPIPAPQLFSDRQPPENLF